MIVIPIVVHYSKKNIPCFSHRLDRFNHHQYMCHKPLLDFSSSIQAGKHVIPTVPAIVTSSFLPLQVDLKFNWFVVNRSNDVKNPKACESSEPLLQETSSINFSPCYNGSKIELVTYLNLLRGTYIFLETAESKLSYKRTVLFEYEIEAIKDILSMEFEPCDFMVFLGEGVLCNKYYTPLCFGPLYHVISLKNKTAEKEELSTSNSETSSQSSFEMISSQDCETTESLTTSSCVYESLLTCSSILEGAEDNKTDDANKDSLSNTSKDFSCSFSEQYIYKTNPEISELSDTSTNVWVFVEAEYGQY